MKQNALYDEDGVPLNDTGPQTTPGGYPVDEIKSALQKAIRRGREEDALHWCAKLYRVDPTNLWKRLHVIASEDIGVGSPSANFVVRVGSSTFALVIDLS
jgi:replication-associated recombination protein RarA